MSSSANFLKVLSDAQALEQAVEKLGHVAVSTHAAGSAANLSEAAATVKMVAENLRKKEDAAAGNSMTWNGETYKMSVSNQSPVAKDNMNGLPTSWPSRTDDGSFYPRMKHAEAVERGAKALDRIAKVMEERLRMHKAGIAQMED